MQSLGGSLYLLALAVWVGGGALYTFVLTPALFGAYPRNTAGDVVGTMMPHYFAVLLAATALAAALLALLRRTLALRLPAVCLALALAAVGVQAYVQWGLYPADPRREGAGGELRGRPDARPAASSALSTGRACS